jgi:hypothetical protein
MDCWINGSHESNNPFIHQSNIRAAKNSAITKSKYILMSPFFADATNEQIGIFIFAGAVVTGFVATLVSVASNFATRRELEDLKMRVDKIETDLDDKTAKIHKRVNRLLAGQMLIAGRVGCSLEQHQDQITAWMEKLDREEE